MDPVLEREWSACPLCGDAGVRHPFRLHGYELADCARCGLLYVRDRVREDRMRRFYGEEYFRNTEELNHGYQDYTQMQRERETTFRAYLRRILPRLQRREQVLDIGCGYGYFLNAARPHFRHLAGVDVSAEALAQADRDYQLVCGEFHGGLFPHGFADLVMMCDLVEHLYHPVAFLQQVRQVLHPKGLLCLVTPNRSSALARVSGRRWVSFKLPEHVCYYDPRTMRHLLDSAGFRMIENRPCGQYATLDFVAKRLSKLLLGSGDRLRLPGFLARRVLYTNSGSMLVLAAVEGG